MGSFAPSWELTYSPPCVTIVTVCLHYFISLLFKINKVTLNGVVQREAEFLNILNSGGAGSHKSVHYSAK